MAEATNDVLLSVADAQLHEVLNGREQLLEWGQLAVSIHTVEGVSGLWIQPIAVPWQCLTAAKMQIGKSEWSFDTATPVLKAADLTYMFAMGGSRFYSVLLAKGTSRDDAAAFEEILVECSSFEYAGAMTKQATEAAVAEVAEEVVNDEDLPLQIAQPQPGGPGHKRTPSDRIMSGAATVQTKLMASANWASQKLLEQSRAMQAKTEPGKPVEISPQTANRVKMARKAAETGHWAANKVAGGIADISIKLADSIVKRLGPNNEYGEQLSDPARRPSAAKEVAAAAVVAAVGIYDSMEQAARVVLNSGGQATSEYIGHKYGPDAGQVAKDAASATVTTGMTAMTVQKIGVKKMARRIAKRTAKGLAKSYLLSPEQHATVGSSGQVQQLGRPSGGGGPPPPAQARLQGQPGPSQQFAGAQYGGVAGGPLPQFQEVRSGTRQPQQQQQQQPGAYHAAAMQAAQPPGVTETMPAPIEYRSPFANDG